VGGAADTDSETGSEKNIQKYKTNICSEKYKNIANETEPEEFSNEKCTSNDTQGNQLNRNERNYVSPSSSQAVRICAFSPYRARRKTRKQTLLVFNGAVIRPTDNFQDGKVQSIADRFRCKIIVDTHPTAGVKKYVCPWHMQTS